MRKLMTMTLLSVLAVCTVALAADISGSWTAAVELDAGSGTATFELQQKGNQLTGKYSGALGEADVTGTVQGNKVEWTFSSAEAGKISYSGTLEGDTKIKGTVAYGELGKGTFTAEKKK
jgi:hypothetical protein